MLIFKSGRLIFGGRVVNPLFLRLSFVTNSSPKEADGLGHKLKGAKGALLQWCLQPLSCMDFAQWFRLSVLGQ